MFRYADLGYGPWTWVGKWQGNIPLCPSIIPQASPHSRGGTLHSPREVTWLADICHPKPSKTRTKRTQAISSPVNYYSIVKRSRLRKRPWVVSKYLSFIIQPVYFLSIICLSILFYRDRRDWARKRLIKVASPYLNNSGSGQSLFNSHACCLRSTDILFTNHDSRSEGSCICWFARKSSEVLAGLHWSNRKGGYVSIEHGA